jgi:serine/threonine protein kinase
MTFNYLKTNEYCVKEAAILSLMNHPNIIKFNCYFESDDNKFSYVMQFMKNGTISILSLSNKYLLEFSSNFLIQFSRNNIFLKRTIKLPHKMN